MGSSLELRDLSCQNQVGSDCLHLQTQLDPREAQSTLGFISEESAQEPQPGMETDRAPVCGVQLHRRQTARKRQVLQERPVEIEQG